MLVKQSKKGNPAFDLFLSSKKRHRAKIPIDTVECLLKILHIYVRKNYFKNK